MKGNLIIEKLINAIVFEIIKIGCSGFLKRLMFIFGSKEVELFMVIDKYPLSMKEGKSEILKQKSTKILEKKIKIFLMRKDFFNFYLN